MKFGLYSKKNIILNTYTGLVEMPPLTSRASRGLHLSICMISIKWRLFYCWKASRSNISYIYWEVEATTWLYFLMLFVIISSWIIYSLIYSLSQIILRMKIPFHMIYICDLFAHLMNCLMLIAYICKS